MAEGGGREEEPDLFGGYDKHWFIKKERAVEYLCGKCSNVFRDPQQIIACGHQVCRSCLPNEVKECPTCRIAVNPHEVFPDVSARTKVAQLQMRCRSKRCKWKGTLKDFEEKHKNECRSQLVKCDNAACNDMVTQEGLVAHLQYECQYRKVACRHCGNEITKAEEETHHENDCLLIPVDCPNECGNEIPREEVLNHVDNECDRTLIDCTFTTVGCEAKVERATLLEHEKTMMPEHLSQAVLAINNIRQERDAMADKIEKDVNNKLTAELRDLSEREETRINRINEIESGLNEFKEQGTVRVNQVEKETKKNFESLTQVVEQSGEFQTILSCIQNKLGTLRGTTIPELQANWDKNLTNNKKLAEKTVETVYSKLSNAVATLRYEMDSKLDNLSTAHAEERTKRLEYEKKTEAEILQLNEDISKNASGLEKQDMALTITKDEMNGKFQDYSRNMQLDYDNLNNLVTKERHSRENDFRRLRKEITDLQLNSNNTGVLIWRVDNVESALSEANKTAKNARYGKAFYSEPHGYVVQPKIFFNGARRDDQGFVSILIRILKGEFDPILKWPFKRHIRFTLIEQESKGFKRDLQKVLIPDRNANEFQRPSEEANNTFGIFKFVSHEELREARYIVDDVMFLKIEVLENIEANGHSETM